MLNSWIFRLCSLLCILFAAISSPLIGKYEMLKRHRHKILPVQIIFLISRADNVQGANQTFSMENLLQSVIPALASAISKNKDSPQQAANSTSTAAKNNSIEELLMNILPKVVSAQMVNGQRTLSPNLTAKISAGRNRFRKVRMQVYWGSFMDINSDIFRNI